jgi:hypothetical protein
MDIIRPSKNLKKMSDTERIEHLKKLNTERVKKYYRKKKMEQLKIKQQEIPKFTLQKVNLDEDINSDEEDTKTLTELYEYIAEEPNNKEILEVIDIFEDKLGIEDKLNACDSSSDYLSDYLSDTD